MRKSYLSTDATKKNGSNKMVVYHCWLHVLTRSKTKTKTIDI